MYSNVISSETGNQAGGKIKPKSRKPPYWAKWAGYLALASIFTTALKVIEEPLPIHLSFILAGLSIVWMMLIQRSKINARTMLVFIVVLTHSAVAIVLGTTSVSLMSKVFVSTVLFYVVFAMVVDIFQHRIDALVHMYIVCCLFVGVVGLLQGLSYLLGINSGYDFSWFLNVWALAPGGPLGIRLNSILPEPSHVAVTMGPAIVLSFYRILNIGPHFLSLPTALILVSFGLLNASSLLLVSLFIAIVLMIRISFKIQMVIAGVGLVFFSVIASSAFIEPSLEKLLGLLELFGDDNSEGYATGTTYTLYVHYKLALAAFADSWGLGSGLGGHEYLFWQYAGDYDGSHNIWSVSTAGNLTFRLISELGVLGLIFIAAFGFVAVSGILRLPAKERLLHAALVAGIAAFFVRSGTYGHFGLAFYVVLLLVNYKNGVRQNANLRNR